MNVLLEKITTFRSYLEQWAIPTTISLFLFALGVLIVSVLLTGHLPPHVDQIVLGFEPYGSFLFLVTISLYAATWLHDINKTTKFFFCKTVWRAVIFLVLAVINYLLFVISVVKLYWLFATVF